MIGRPNIREQTEKREEALSPYAAKSKSSRGRLRWEEPCPIRTSFQRDRDRVLHARAFRRLKHKTQVFLNPEGDHFVTRLTHTVHVNQVGRAMAVSLGLNEALTEEMARDDNVFIIGEDIAVGYGGGGVFGATRGLLDKFGVEPSIGSLLIRGQDTLGMHKKLAHRALEHVSEQHFGRQRRL